MIKIIFELCLTVIISYLIGSIPTGYLIVRAKTGQDIRTIGSGSTGATNVKRVMGKKWFFIVLLLDAIKGMIPVLLAQWNITIPSSITTIGTTWRSVSPHIRQAGNNYESRQNHQKRQNLYGRQETFQGHGPGGEGWQIYLCRR